MNTILSKIIGLPVFTAMLAAGLFLNASCSSDREEYGEMPSGDQIILTFSMEGHNSHMPTRSSVAPLPQEEQLESLSLLFFEYSEDGSGMFLNSYTMTDNLVMNTQRPINLGIASGLNNSTSYSILAVANLADKRYISGTPLEWTNGLRGKTESEVIQSSLGQLLSGQVIEPGQILMTGRTSKLADEQKLDLILKRAVARYDVHNLLRDKYDLISVTVTNAANKTPMWNGGTEPVIGHLQELYTVASEDDGTGQKKDIIGGVYSFENLSVSPRQNDNVTTGLLIGLSPRTGEPFTGWTAGEIRYFRINMHPDSASQNILRNNAYKITIKNVIGEGSPTKSGARQSEEKHLDYVINNWDYDDNGMILFDGLNTLVAPAKTIVLDPAGETREYSIFTQGPGQLAIRNYQMDNGLSATLSGNILKVTATPLGSETERNGSLDITIGSLKGTIYLVQSPNARQFLRINKSKATSFPGTGINGMLDGPIEVSSSGAWKAKIFNNDQLSGNPGFSFSPTDAQLYELSLSANGGSNSFQIYTTGSNPSEQDARTSFILVWLEENENFNASMVLLQKKSTSFSVTPGAPGNTVTFTPTGAPQMLSGAQPGDRLRFQVHSGEGAVPGTVNPWNIEITGAHEEYFGITTNINPDNPTDNNNYFEIWAKGTHPGSNANYLTQTLTAAINVYLDIPGSTDKCVRMDVRQGPLSFKVNEAGNTPVPVKGGVVNNGTGLYIETTATPTFTWSAVIISQTHGVEHPAYFLDDNGDRQTSLSGMPLSSNLKVGFDKIMYPLTYVSPSVVIEVSVDNTELKDEVTITQAPLEQRPFWLQSFRAGYGHIRPNNPNVSSATGLEHSYMVGWANYLWDTGTSNFQNHKLFGPSPTAMVFVESKNFYYTFFTSDNLPEIWEGITWMQHARADLSSVARWETIDKWQQKNDGNWVVICNDEPNSTSFTNALTTKGYTRGNLYGPPRPNQDAASTKVMQYLLKEGPFTQKASIPATGYTFSNDGIRTPVASWPEQAVPIIIEKDDNNNMSATVVIDFKNRYIYLGEGQINEACYSGSELYDYISRNVNTTTETMYRSKFNANLLAFIANATMYGTHFTDLFLENGWTPIK